MEISITNKVMVCAFEKGYTVDKKGDVYFKGRKRSLVLDSKGYYTFTVRVKIEGDEKCTRVWVHKLQAYQKFKEKMFEQNILVRHLNSNQSDNSYHNITIGTPSNNSFDMPEKRRIERAIHASSKQRKFSDEIISLINEDRESGMTYRQICKKYNISSKGTLNYILTKSYYNNKRIVL